ncbi:MAG: 2-oxoacid:acceptor oxidoreductase family protein, partial [Thermomicrobia bacterium]|nr:2-oxoacid:acceptor oxidoreductase family protein [Thermomicrobia bacterium]
SVGDQVDVLVTLNKEAWTLHHNALRPDGALIFDPSEYQPPAWFMGTKYEVPAVELANKAGAKRGKNIVIIGAIAKLFGLDAEVARETITKKLGKRAELLQGNLDSFNAGYEYAGSLMKADRFGFTFPETRGNGNRLIMNGNDAIVAGAIRAGCRFYGGYPITPASDIMEKLAVELPVIGGALLQGEDEIASINACLGASWAGVKAMTATAGPGLSLMTEALGMASMAEIPVVVVDAQRGGPSTGLPTKTEQSDLNLAVYGAHGDTPRMVVAPTEVGDCFTTTVLAFNLSERYQMPVLLLSDQSLSSRTESIARPDLENVEVWDRITPENAEKYAHLVGRNGHATQSSSRPEGTRSPQSSSEQSEGNRNAIEEDPSGDPVYVRHETALLSYGVDLTHVGVDRLPPEGHYLRYAITESGISPMSVPGMKGDTRYVSTGIEHDQLADPNYTPEYHTVMTNKRFRKLQTAINDLGDTVIHCYGAEDPDVLVIAWGSTAGPAREAVERAVEEGQSVGLIVPILLWPLVPSIGAALAKAKKVVIPEVNYAGQFARLLRAEFGGDRDTMIEVHKYTGLPFTAIEIANVIEEAGNGRPLPFRSAPDLVRRMRRFRRARRVLRGARRPRY